MSGQRSLLVVVSLIVLPVLPLARADDAQPEPGVDESFNGKLRLPWKVVRPDAKRYSLTKNKGKLTITTQRGTIHRGAERKEVKAKNLFLIGNPYGRSGDFEVSVRISDFRPNAYYQQGGLLLYDDDDNYLKLVCESDGRQEGSAMLVLLRETDGKSDIVRAPAPQDRSKVWLRLTRRKGKYEYASSPDGKKWRLHGETEWGQKGPARIGLLAKNGGTDAPEIDVCFDEFRVRPLTAVRAKTD